MTDAEHAQRQRARLGLHVHARQFCATGGSIADWLDLVRADAGVLAAYQHDRGTLELESRALARLVWSRARGWKL